VVLQQWYEFSVVVLARVNYEFDFAIEKALLLKLVIDLLIPVLFLPDSRRGEGFIVGGNGTPARVQKAVFRREDPPIVVNCSA